MLVCVDRSVGGSRVIGYDIDTARLRSAEQLWRRRDHLKLCQVFRDRLKVIKQTHLCEHLWSRSH